MSGRHARRASGLDRRPETGRGGISFGSFLVKQVVCERVPELPRLRIFATLYPLSGLQPWLEAEPARLVGHLDDALRAALGARAPVSVAGVPALVARFHRDNGARIERLDPGTDIPRLRLEGAAGIVANYRYERDEFERNHEALAAMAP